MKSIFLGAVIAALVASPTLAADLMIDTPPAPPVVASGDWSGPYVGIFAGGGTGVGESDTGSGISRVDVSGALLGATAGANMQMDSFVLGVEGDIAWSNISGQEVCQATPSFDCAGSLNWLATVRGRAGLAMDQVLLYGTAGIAVANADLESIPTPALATGEYSDTFTGWTVGIGAELKVSDSMSLKAEYDYYDLGTRTAPAGTLTSLSDDDIHPTLSTVKLGLNFHF